jgi:hypothetical protein
VGAIELTAMLWREREALQAVLERQQDLVSALRAADPGGIDRAVSALEDVLDRLRPVILMRDIEVAAVAEEWGAEPGLSLARLPKVEPPGPWGEIFSAHLDALRHLAVRAVEQQARIDAGFPPAEAGRVPGLPVALGVYTDPSAK